MVELNRKTILEDMSNNQILVEMREMKLDHESIKGNMLKQLKRLEDLEEKYDKYNKVLHTRLKG